MTSNQLAEKITPGASFDAFANHPGYRRMFAENQLTIGIFLPLRFYQGDMRVLEGQTTLVKGIDERGFASIWVRDVPLYDPSFGDAGQVFDPFTYLAYLAAHTSRTSLATGSAIFSLRHPIDLAKAATTIDQLSGGRLVLGIASGDRPVEFPAYGLDLDNRGERFAESVHYFRQLLTEKTPAIRSPLGEITQAEFLPKPAFGRIPLLVTGSSRQTPEWAARYADGWLTYPQATHHSEGPKRLAQNIKRWRDTLPDSGFRPHVTNEWIELTEDPDFPRTPLNGGFTLKTGRKGLIDLLGEWQQAGVNHAALGMQFATRPPAEIIQELAEEVLPLFPSLDGPAPSAIKW
ncbi:LLM class oxidoreductase [Pseudochrobactrum asaccharolyticum]|uniref:LLM class oxidoreductase n=1 Tax=Pseudochrobactrum asaccharolyticum TaxID=354351 RepID=UPI001F4896E8|nr:LLM class oxidoreductase [Pseudochrobactrum asaccharolyticum]MCF7647249.1 LLM class oxidoreductase [Pseudochrobactrum asaccharolyticum]